VASATDALSTLLESPESLLSTDLHIMRDAASRRGDEAAFRSALLTTAGDAWGTRGSVDATVVDGVLREVEKPTGWEDAVRRWRRKTQGSAFKYRITNPVGTAGVYTWMVNVLVHHGQWETARDALTYAGLIPAGPFFVKPASAFGLSAPGDPPVYHLDRLALYVAESMLDVDIGSGQRDGEKRVTGLEELHCGQMDEAASVEGAAAVKDMAYAAARVGLRDLCHDRREHETILIACQTSEGLNRAPSLLLSREHVLSLVERDMEKETRLVQQQGEVEAGGGGVLFSVDLKAREVA